MSNPPAPKRRPGRPKKFIKVTGRQAAKVGVIHAPPPLQPLGPQSMITEPTRHPEFFCPPITSTEATFLAAMSLMPSTAQLYGQASVTNNNMALFLDSIPRPVPQWHLVDTVRTLDIPYWFDMQLNDYNVKRYNFSDLVELTWMGHPHDSPYDIRARPCVVQWKEPSSLSSDARAEASKAGRVLCRWEFTCRGTCALKLSPEETQGYAHCLEKVKLVAELNAANFYVVHIWQRGNHSDASVLHELQPSRRLRNEVLTAMRLLGTRVSTIMKDIVLKYRFPMDNSRPHNTTVVWLQMVPEWRRFTRTQLRTMFANAHKSARLDHDPLRAIDILAKRNPNKVYYYNPHESSRPDSMSNFTCAISTNWGLENILLHGLNDGIGIDTTWRGMNENRAGVTFITTVDQNGHMAPASALLSANIRAGTLERFLHATESRVRSLAELIIANPTVTAHQLPGDQVAILQACHEIQAEGHLKIKKVMIDKSASLLKAIRKYNPKIPIIICQFHIIQALCRLQGDDKRLPDAPRLSWKFKYNMCLYFRRAQRCRTMHEWPKFRDTFLRQLENLCLGITSESDDEAGNETTSTSSSTSVHGNSEEPSETENMVTQQNRRKVNHFPWLKDYFMIYWFNDTWLSHVTDMGLPPGETRNGSMNTNNWSESTFLVFRNVFQDGRTNKRIDRLAAIIMNEWLPFYEFWPTEHQNPPADIQLMINRAHVLWDRGMIREMDATEIAKVHGTPPMYRVQDMLHPELFQSAHVDLKIPRCSCPGWNQTGKLCVHIRAAQLFVANGPIRVWQDQEYLHQKSLGHVRTQSKVQNSKAIHSNHSSSRERHPPSRHHPTSDKTLNKHLHRLIHALGPNETTMPTAKAHGNPVPIPPKPSPSNITISQDDGFRTGWSQAGGRNANLTAMVPWRKHKSHNKSRIIFNKKRGRKGTQRLARNSLIQHTWNHPLGKKKVLPRGNKSMYRTLTKKKRALRSSMKTSNMTDIYQTTGCDDDEVLYGDDKQCEDTLHDEVRNTETIQPRGVPTPQSQQTHETGLTAEDSSILTTNFARWNLPYQLRIEEVEVIVEMLNSLALTKNLPWWFFISGGANQDQLTARILKNVHDDLNHKPGTYAHRLLSSEVHQRCQIMFLDLSHSHWTVWEYQIGLPKVSCTGYNPMQHRDGLSQVQRRTQVAICNALRKRAFAGAAVPPTPLLIEDSYDAHLTGLQKSGDGTSCGFWSTIIGIARIMGVTADLSFLHLYDVQRIIAKLWTQFLTHEKGIMGEYFLSVADKLGADSYWQRQLGSDPNAVVAYRPAYISQAEPAIPLRYPATWGKKLTELELYTRICAAQEPKITFPGFQLSAPEINQLKDPKGRLKSSMISGYLALYIRDHVNMDPTGLTLPFLVFDVMVTSVMSYQKTQQPFKPREALVSWKFWAPQVNVFWLEWVFLPWHIPGQDHWILVFVRPKEYKITIHDSLSQKMGRNHHRICNRVLKFLQFEHRARFGIELPPTWEENLQKYYHNAVIHCPLQHDNVVCGLIVIALIKGVCEGEQIENIDALTNDQLHEIRQSMLVRLAREWEYIEEEESSSDPPVNVGDHTHTDPTTPTLVVANPCPLPGPELVAPKSSSVAPEGHVYMPRLGESTLWQPSHEELFYPVFVVSVSPEVQIVQLEIPAGVVNSKGVVAWTARTFEISFQEWENIFTLNVNDIHPENVASIVWPELSDDRQLQMILEENDNKLDLVETLSQEQKLAISDLRKQFPLIIAAMHGDQSVFPGLLSAWEETVRIPGNKMETMQAFVNTHLQLLDNQMQCIVRTLAGHEVMKMIASGIVEASDLVVTCMLGYIALGHELGIPTSEAYSAALAQQITRQPGIYEQMWLTMLTWTTQPGPASKWPQNRANFTASHRIPYPIRPPALRWKGAKETRNISLETPTDGNAPTSSPQPSYRLTRMEGPATLTKREVIFEEAEESGGSKQGARKKLRARK